MKIIPGGVLDKAGIKLGINSATIGLEKITEEDIDKALKEGNKRWIIELIFVPQHIID